MAKWELGSCVDHLLSCPVGNSEQSHFIFLKLVLTFSKMGLEGESLYRVTASLCPPGNSEFGHFGEVDQGLLHCLKGTFLSLE